MKIRKWKLFWAWQDREEEAWLRTMAQRGYHFARMVFPMRYEFSVGEPGDVVYRMDYTDVRKKDLDTYLQYFEDAGWEYIDSGMGWFYFRKPADAEGVNEIFTDAESKIEKYQRMLTYFIIFPIVLFATFIPQIGADVPFLCSHLFLDCCCYFGSPPSRAS